MLEQLIRFYGQYEMYLDGMFRYIHVLVCVIIGIVARNVFDDKVELEGSKLFFGSIFLSLILFHAGSWMNKHVLFGTSLVFGFGCNDLVNKWIKSKIWNKYDFISRGNKRHTRRKKDEDKDNKDNEEDSN